MINLTSASDLNTVGIPNKRIINKYGSSTLHTPYAEGITGNANAGRVETYLSSEAHGIQVAYPSGKNYIACRNLSNGIWGTWTKGILSNDIQTNNVSLGPCPGNANTNFNVVFPTPFATIPKVLTSLRGDSISPAYGNLSTYAVNITTTGFVFRVANASNIQVNPGGVWIAMTK